MKPICGRCGHPMLFHRKFRGMLHRLYESGTATMENYVCVPCGQTVFVNVNFISNWKGDEHVVAAHEANLRRVDQFIEFHEYPVSAGDELLEVVRPNSPKQLDLFKEEGPKNDN